MGEMSSICGYEEVQNQDMDQLVQKLLYTTLELEKPKSEKMIQVQKNKEDVDKLILLLKCAIQERDEARNELGKLVRIIPDIFSIFPEFKPVMANSSMPEPNSLSDTYSYNSHGLPPAKSLIDVVPPPEFSNMVASQPLVDFSAKIDQESLIVDNFLKGRVLPRNGMFVQAVLEAGPLLQTLLVAGPLPKWRNPPQPPVSIKGGDAEVLGAPIVGQMSAHSYANLRCVRSGSLASPGVSINDYFHLGKRHRFC